MLDELESTLQSVIKDTSVKALVISGEGRAFSTGADLKAVRELFDRWADYVKFLYQLTRVCRTLEELPIPTIAKVHGYALAGGLELLLCCDLAIASDDAQIGDQHANFGLIAGSGGIPRLVRRIGRQAAVEILFTGRWLSGTEAASKGIVLKSVPQADLDRTIAELTDQLIGKSRESFGYIKRVAIASEDAPLITGLNEERAALIEYFSTSKHPREGIQAFIERRPPNFGE
jgi:enoyl-CoA hydratase/carnithine racemase